MPFFTEPNAPDTSNRLPPGSRPDYGGVVWPVGGNEAMAGPRFDVAVGPGGYAWWYCDALSDDGNFGLTIIAFIGSVFSPYYAWSGRRDPIDHSAINVALYGRDRKRHWTKGRWAMTERRKTAVEVGERDLQIGRSALSWDGSELVIEINETTTPVPLPIKGKVRVIPDGITKQIFALDADGHHRWWPIAPTARVEVDLETPAVTWGGHGYLDSNDGEIPLEHSFETWDWARASLSEGAAVLYDVIRADGERLSLALRFKPDGEIEAFEPPQRTKLPKTLWGIARNTQADDGRAKVVKTMEDTPFYARSELETHVLGERAPAIHESLSLSRFKSDWVKLLLPFRMPRDMHG
ncbi:MAG: carotenoid 1,2-hydratase [Pseudomonadota bacterium]